MDAADALEGALYHPCSMLDPSYRSEEVGLVGLELELRVLEP